jgi:TPR repeat protein
MTRVAIVAAQRYFEAAHAAGAAEGAFFLGVLHHEGLVVAANGSAMPPNITKAIELYTVAAQVRLTVTSLLCNIHV